MSYDLLRMIKVMECHFVHSAELRLMNVIGFIQQNLGYEISLNLHLFIQQD